MDPLAFLGLSPEDATVAVAALNHASELIAKRDKAMADYQASQTAGLTVQGITRWLGKALR